MDMPTPSSPRRPLPVLMIPLRRCGSHALRLRLNASPKFYSPYPLHIVDFMPLVPLYGDLSNDEAYFRLIVDVIGLQAISMVKWETPAFDPVEIFEALANERRSVHRVVWELLLRAGELRGASTVMDKSLDSIHYARELLEILPDMRFLNVVRDPRAQVASMNRAIIHDFDALLNARAWLKAHVAASAIATEFSTRVLTIRYEDFLSDQKDVLERICRFFEIDFMPQMLDVSESQEARAIAKRSALWESNSYPPIAANAVKFTRQLSGVEIEIIETVTREYMKRYGYTLMTTADASIPRANYRTAMDRSETKKAMAWSELQRTNYKDFTFRRFRKNYLAMIKQSFQPAEPDTAAAVGLHHQLTATTTVKEPPGIPSKWDRPQ